MKRVSSIIICLVLLVGLFAGCSSTTPNTPINIVALKGPTAMGLIQLMQNELDGTNKNYTITVTGTADDVVARVTKGEVDVAAVPANMASILYNKTNGAVKVAVVNTLGVLYVLDTSDSVKTIEDLAGKTLYSVGKGTTPEYALNYVLEKNNLTDSVTVEYKSEATELAALLANGQAELAMLPEPYVTTVLAQNEKAKIALSLTEEWDKVQPDFSLVTGVLIVRTEFLEKNKKAFDAFLDDYKKSVDFVNTSADAPGLVAKFSLTPNAEVAKAAIPRCNIVFKDGEDCKKFVSSYLETLNAANPQSIGGKLPDEGFYYKK